MTIAPALAVLGAAVLLGGWLGTKYLMRSATTASSSACT